MAIKYYKLPIDVLRRIASEKGLSFDYHPRQVVFYGPTGSIVGRIFGEREDIRVEMNRFISTYQEE